MRRLALAALLALALTATPTAAQECRFVLGFATLRDLIGAEKVGACLEDQQTNPENGNAEQRTRGGLMVWRKADNFTAFTDGGTTWINGPNGLQSRPNAERFSWESDPVQGGPAPQQQTVTAPEPAATRQVAAPTATSRPAADAPTPTVRAAPKPGSGAIVCNDGTTWPGTTRQGACNGRGGIAPGY